MSEISKNMDSVFDQCTENELDFDVVFDQEDCLIDTVAGVNESGDPVTGSDDFEVMHQTADEATPKDIEDELGEGHDVDNGAPNPEGTEKAEVEDVSVKGEVDKPSEADKFIGDPEEEYQDAKDSAKDADANDVTATIDKAVEEGMDIDALLNESEGADADVINVADADPEEDQRDIDEVLSNDAEDEDLEYELSDEDLIDMAINGKSL